VIMQDALGLIKGVANTDAFEERKVDVKVWDIKI